MTDVPWQYPAQLRAEVIAFGLLVSGLDLHGYLDADHSYILCSQVVNFDDLTTTAGLNYLVLAHGRAYHGKYWTADNGAYSPTHNYVYKASSNSQFPAASSPNWLFVNPGEFGATLDWASGSNSDAIDEIAAAPQGQCLTRATAP